MVPTSKIPASLNVVCSSATSSNTQWLTNVDVKSTTTVGANTVITCSSTHLTDF